jgi:HSP20 family molecular chaperone IbpA
MSDKIKVMPCACFSHDEEGGGRLRIDMEMTGVDKKDIALEMRKDTFCVSAPRSQETEYAGCFKLSHEIVPEKAEAKYESGTLTIFAPIKDWDRKVNVSIQ